jgi:rsbT co-antagonist protein RsbR
MLEAELEAITIHRATVMPVDITGVIVDTRVALQLIRAADAAKLLGCQTILVGVRPEIAQTLVGLGIDLRGIATRATLANGLETALRLGRRQIVEMR